MYILIVLLAIVVVVVAFTYAFMSSAAFGRISTGNAMDAIRNSPHYKDGAFQNLSHTPMMAEGTSYFTVMRKFFFDGNKNKVPPAPIPAVKTDLKVLNLNEDLIVWFGHSSYYMHIDGKRILVDPVLSGYASPVSFSTKAFSGTDVYKPEDFPSIDFLFITHDHFDHLDYKAVTALRPKVARVITTLGTGAHLLRWGYKPAQVTETDWYERTDLGDGFIVNTVPGRHFSGRTFKRGQALWAAFVLATPNRNIFIGGDSGYDSHFKAIGDKFGPFDLAMLENGQYNAYWAHIHMMPEEVVQAAIDLKAKVLFPVHWGKFSLSLHDWDEPIRRVTREAILKGQPMIHPQIGEVVRLNNLVTPQRWWETIKR